MSGRKYGDRTTTNTEVEVVIEELPNGFNIAFTKLDGLSTTLAYIEAFSAAVWLLFCFITLFKQNDLSLDAILACLHFVTPALSRYCILDLRSKLKNTDLTWKFIQTNVIDIFIYLVLLVSIVDVLSLIRLLRITKSNCTTRAYGMESIDDSNDDDMLYEERWHVICVWMFVCLRGIFIISGLAYTKLFLRIRDFTSKWKELLRKFSQNV